MSDIRIERIETVPMSSWNLPEDELYVQLGCAACPKKTCFVAKGVTSAWPPASIHPREAEELDEQIGLVEKYISVHQASTTENDDPCLGVCSEEENIVTATVFINETFKANI